MLCELQLKKKNKQKSILKILRSTVCLSLNKIFLLFFHVRPIIPGDTRCSQETVWEKLLSTQHFKIHSKMWLQQEREKREGRARGLRTDCTNLITVLELVICLILQKQKAKSQLNSFINNRFLSIFYYYCQKCCWIIEVKCQVKKNLLLTQIIILNRE